MKPFIVLSINELGQLVIQGPVGEENKALIISALADAIKIVASPQKRVIEPQVN